MLATSTKTGLKGLVFTSIFYSSAALISGAALCLIAAPQASAQDYTSGGIEGILSQPDGTAASGITVTIEDEARGLRRSSVTDEGGHYRFARLPIGTYQLGAVAGLNTLSKQVDVQVNDLSVANFTFGAQMADIVATGRKTAKSDFNIAELGLINDVDLLFESQPIGRDATSLALLAAGAVPGDNAFGDLPSISGSSVAENVYYINGMNITDSRNLIESSTVPFEFYDQVEIKTGGYGAEFGRSTGGVINAVSKSGSNEFHFGVSGFWEPDNLRGDVLDRYSQTGREIGGLEELSQSDYNLWASGPIIKDRLFFYGLYNPRDFERTTYTFDPVSLTGQRVTQENDDPFYAAKLDLALTDNHLFEYTFIQDENNTRTSTANVEYDESGNILNEEAVDGSGNDFSGGRVNIFKYTGTFGDNISLSALYGKQTFDQTVNSSFDAFPVIRDDRGIEGNPLFPIGFVNFFVEAGEDERELLRIDADYHLADFWGDHHFRLGLDQETLQTENFGEHPGGLFWRYFDAETCDAFADGNPAHTPGSFCGRLQLRATGGEYESVQRALYLQDAWRVNNQLTLNLGIRNETFDNENADGENFIEITDQWAARLGFGYQLNDQTQFFGNYGRYYLPVPTSASIRLASADDFTREFFDIEETLNDDGTPILTSESYNFVRIGTGEVGDTSSLVSEDIEPMFQDEFILGVRHSFDSPLDWLDGWDVSASLTYRDLRETLEDISIDRGVVAWCEREGITGCEQIWNGTHQYVLTNPGQDFVVFTSEADGDAIGGEGTGALRLTLRAEDIGIPRPDRTYIGARFTADKLFDWGNISANYTLSESEGNFEGSVKSDIGQADVGSTQNFDLPELTEGADGNLPNDHTHQFLVRGTYKINDIFRMGGNYSLTSPRSFGCLGIFEGDVSAVVSRAYGNTTHYCGGELVQRGSALESDWINNLDLSLIATPDILPQGVITLRADLFNVFNAQGETDLQEFGDSVSGAPLESYGLASNYQSPRSVRFGVSYAY